MIACLKFALVFANEQASYEPSLLCSAVAICLTTFKMYCAQQRLTVYPLPGGLCCGLDGGVFLTCCTVTSAVVCVEQLLNTARALSLPNFQEVSGYKILIKVGRGIGRSYLTQCHGQSECLDYQR